MYRHTPSTVLFIYRYRYYSIIFKEGEKGDWDFQIFDLVKNPDGTDI